MPGEDKQGGWWQTLPGVLTAAGTLIAALTGLIVAVNQGGLFHGSSTTSTVIGSTATTPVAPISTAAPTSVAPQLSLLPRVIGLPIRNAEQELRSEGFANIHVSRRATNAAPGTVIEEVPTPGTNMALNEPIGLVLAIPMVSVENPVMRNPAGAPAIAQFAGVWQEFTETSQAPTLWLNLQQNGAKVTVQESYNGTFNGRVFGHATASGSEATWVRPNNPCGKQYQRPGFSYDDPGSTTYSLRLDGSILLYEVRKVWPAPCGPNEAGTMRTAFKKLRRVNG